MSLYEIGMMIERDEAEKKGKLKGAEAKAVEVIKNGLSDGFTVEQIAKLLRITPAKVKQLMKEHNIS